MMGFAHVDLLHAIFALGIKGLGGLTKTASSFIVMSIVGGEILPLALGRVSDHSSIRMAFIVPGLCFAVVALFAFYACGNERRGLFTELTNLVMARLFYLAGPSDRRAPLVALDGPRKSATTASSERAVLTKLSQDAARARRMKRDEV